MQGEQFSKRQQHKEEDSNRHTICDTSSSSGGKVLAVRKLFPFRMILGVIGLEFSTSDVKSAELNRNTGADSDKRG